MTTIIKTAAGPSFTTPYSMAEVSAMIDAHATAPNNHVVSFDTDGGPVLLDPAAIAGYQAQPIAALVGVREAPHRAESAVAATLIGDAPQRRRKTGR
jgi:hypothetical protein